MSLYTGKGDRGETFCFLFGGYVPKDHPAIEFLGCLDEANSSLGLAISRIDGERFSNVASDLIRLQRILFRIGFTVSGRFSLDEGDLRWMEERTDFYYSKYPLKYFILPGGPGGAAELHLSRTVLRRCERRYISMRREVTVEGDELIMKLLNRASDLVFSIALYVAGEQGYTNPKAAEE